MHLVLVADQTAGALVRALIAGLAIFGDSTREWVFDDPRRARISPLGARPVVLHRLLRQLVAEPKSADMDGGRLAAAIPAA
jgi:hypothetical protein